MQLIIQQPGAKLSVKDGMYHVRAGEQEHLISPVEISGIVLNRACVLTFEAVALAVAHETEMVFLENTGMPIARVWSHKYGSISTIRKHQVDFARSPDALDWVKQTLARKLENQATLLAVLQPADLGAMEAVAQAKTRIEASRARILELPGSTVESAAATLRGLEGSAGVAYFGGLSAALPEAYRFEGRSSQPAEDMFNALLNYAYGMLYVRIEGALIRAGIDPYLGIFHRDDYNRPVFVYDFIETYRVWAEYVVVRLCMDQVIFPEFFDRENGFFLNPGGKRILIQSFNDYLEEVVDMRSLLRSRATHIELDAQRFAQTLKTYGVTGSNVQVEQI